MQNDWTMNIKQNVMSHTRITHDKFHIKKYKMAASRPFFLLLFFSITRTTNKEILVSAFQEKVSSRSSYLANIHSNVSQ